MWLRRQAAGCPRAGRRRRLHHPARALRRPGPGRGRRPGRRAGGVGGGDGQRTAAAQEAQGELVGGHAHGEGTAGLPQVPGEGPIGLQDEGQRPGPEGLHEGSGGLGHLGDEPGQVGGVGHEDRRGHLASAPLGGQQPLNGPGVGGVAADAVDGVRGQDDEPACAQVIAGRSEGVGVGMSGARGGLRGVAHVPHPATDRVGGGTVRRCGPGRDAGPSPERVSPHRVSPGPLPG